MVLKKEKFSVSATVQSHLTYDLWRIVFSLYGTWDVVLAGTHGHVCVFRQSRIRGPLFCKLWQTLNRLIGDGVNKEELITIEFNIILAVFRHVPLTEGQKAKQVSTCSLFKSKKDILHGMLLFALCSQVGPVVFF